MATGSLTSTGKAERYIRGLLTKSKRSPRAVAREAHVSPLTLARMRGDRDVDEDAAHRVIEALGGNWDEYLWLVEGRRRSEPAAPSGPPPDLPPGL